MKTVAWDVDDVLNDLMRVWFEGIWLREHPDCVLTYQDITENPPHKILGATLDEYLDSLDRFRLSGKYSKMSPLREVKGWFIKYGARYRHIAVSGVPLAAAHISAEWVLRHFGPWIRSFNFIPSGRERRDSPLYDNDKAGFMKWFGKIDILVDDNMSNIKAAEEAGIKALAMPRPWNGNNGGIVECLKRLQEVLE